ncbi:MAG: hypothetical protein JWR63_4242, partial [Conexibacter sp.]|nr:hypothetical protein [Conexibacter sp.]
MTITRARGVVTAGLALVALAPLAPARA